MAVPSIECFPFGAIPEGSEEFTWAIFGTAYACTSSEPLFSSGSSFPTLTSEDFNTLWPLILGLIVTGYIAGVLRRQF